MPKLITIRIACFVCLLQLGLTTPSQAAPKSEAYTGQPVGSGAFGVGRVTLGVLRGEVLLPLSDERFTAFEAEGRVCYPVLKQERFRGLVRGLLDIKAPRNVTIYYLFQGDDPFELSAFTPHEQGIRVKPRRDAAGHRRLLKAWWKETQSHYHKLHNGNAYSPVAENYLIATLGRRLGLSTSKPQHNFGPFSSSLVDNLRANLFVDDFRLLSVDWAMLQPVPAGQFKLSELPQPIQWPSPPAAKPELDQVAVEALATHVPAECFYVRFGNFTNYLWFRNLNKKWQGDLGNMILRRGIRRNAGQRLEQQLALHETALSKLLGPQVISDAAIIGLDHYVGQGAAIGILFQAKNEFLLSTNMMSQRREALTKFDDAKEETLDIAGHSVSLVSTPDGQVRSYYVKHEGFHLVTTSRTLVERFLQAAQGQGSLAKLPSFQRLRQRFPLERKDTLLAFASEAYWQNLSSPHYLIENERRLRASRESLLFDLARYAAQGESHPARTTEELIAANFLPNSFGTRTDGSQLLFTAGNASDSLRGARGFYVPIADMQVNKVSKQEQTLFQEFSDNLKAESKRLPSIAAAIKRSPIPLAAADAESLETITIELHVAGVTNKASDFLGWPGPPTKNRLQPLQDNLISVEAITTGASVRRNARKFNQHYFFGLQDSHSPVVIEQGKIREDSSLLPLEGYLGAWPTPGILGFFIHGKTTETAAPTQIDGQSFSAEGPLWQAKKKDFFLLSFKPEVIKKVLPQLKMVPAEREAQLRLDIQNLTGTKLAQTVSAFGYAKTRDASAASSRMMNALANQLRLPRHECRAVAERLVDGKFVCPLGGEYQLYTPPRGLEVWSSSALPEQNRFLLTDIPADYQHPLLSWFRGLKCDLRIGKKSLDVHIEITTTSAGIN